MGQEEGVDLLPPEIGSLLISPVIDSEWEETGTNTRTHTLGWIVSMTQ